jgi:5'-nucleotidase
MKRLIVDMDDVLADTSQAILEAFNTINHTNYNKEYFRNKVFYEFINQAQFESIRPMIEAKGFFADLPVMADAVQVMHDLQAKYDVFVVSAATEFPNSLEEKYHWLANYFPFIHWKNFVLCGDKSIIKGDIMIDDHEKNLKTFEGESLLFDAVHNWHLEGYQRVHNWKEIELLLN